MSAVAANDCELEFDYSAKAWDCKINVGIDSGMTLRMSESQLIKNMYEKVAESDPDSFGRFWSNSNATIKRKASREYLKLWAIAAVAGSRQAFEDEVFLQFQKYKTLLTSRRSRRQRTESRSRNRRKRRQRT